MKSIITYVLLFFIATIGCAQKTKMENFTIINGQGITNIKYGIYPKNTIIKNNVYKKRSKAKNKTIEQLLSSRLSETDLDWHLDNHDNRTEKDRKRREKDRKKDYAKIYKERVSRKMNYELISVLTYDWEGAHYAKVFMFSNSINSKKYKYVITKKMIKKEGRWFFTENYPREMLDFFIGNINTLPNSVLNILNKKPTNEGESLMLAQSLNAQGELELSKLGLALYSIKKQAKTNPEIQKIVLDTSH